MTPRMWIASAMWVLLVVGYLFRRNRKIHVPFVLSGITGDIALVLYLEITKSAVESALKFDRSFLQQAHIAASTVALVLYFVVLYLGFRLLRGDLSVRQRHVRIATTALCFRSLGFVLMFSMWKD